MKLVLASHRFGMYLISEGSSFNQCFSLQLCFRVQLDPSSGGLGGEALYLDTEDGFRPERIEEIASNYYSNIYNDQNLLKFKIQEVMTRIHVRKVNTNADDLCNIILQLDSFFESYSNIRLLVIDSISYHFRYDYDYGNDHMTQQLLQIACKLKQLAHERNIAVSKASGKSWLNFCFQKDSDYKSSQASQQTSTWLALELYLFHFSPLESKQSRSGQKRLQRKE